MSFSPGNLIFVTGILLYAAIRHRFERRAAGNKHVVNRADLRERLLIAVMAVGSFSQ